MKIASLVIQDRNITEYSKHRFIATYKGKKIYITDDHGYGKPKFDHLTRYCMEVVDIKTGMYDVKTWDDFHEMKYAIMEALKGAMLLERN